MTGTADTEAQELHQIYKLDVSVIPTNKPMIRNDQPDLVYKNEAGKFRAVVADVEDCYKRGQPVLVGTVSVEKSEVVANLLKAKGLPFNVLNAKQHQREAVDRRAGRAQGRDHDRDQHGRPRHRHRARRQPRGDGQGRARRGEGPAAPRPPTASQPVERRGRRERAEPYRGSTEPAFDEDKRATTSCSRSSRRSARPSARRCSPPAASRSSAPSATSRAGSTTSCAAAPAARAIPGSSRFYLSLQDDLLRIFGLDRMTGLMERLGLEEDVPIESPMVTRSIEGAQKKVEGRNFDQRKNVLEYDDVMNQQRKTIYALRRQILEGRYHREPTEDEAKQGIVPEPVTVERRLDESSR